jgi:DNA-binding XRE family transcriptional regulator
VPRIRELREAKQEAATTPRSRRRYARVAVARFLDVTERTVYNWEAGVTSPGKDQAIDLAEYLGCSVDDLELEG